MVDLDTEEDMIVTTSASTKTLVVDSVPTPASSSTISIACNISPCSFAVSEPARNCCQKDNSSLSALQRLVGVVRNCHLSCHIWSCFFLLGSVVLPQLDLSSGSSSVLSRSMITEWHSPLLTDQTLSGANY